MNIEENKISHPFKVPESYFDDLEGNILSQIKIEALKKDTIFKVEDDYFDKLESKILAQTVEKAAPKANFTVIKSKRNIYRGAAAVALISILSYAVFQSNSSPKDSFSDISNQEMIEYLGSQPIETSQIVNALDEKTIKEMSVISNDTKNFNTDELLNELN